MADRAEAYDVVLSSFLRRMLDRPDMTNTIIVLRADHGLQGGSTTPDYSIQQEALRPWTEIIVPKNLPGLSLDTLFNNQQRLATGFDLYNTITDSIVGTSQSIAPEMPRWTHHLWKNAIPSSRTCVDANVRAEYCLLESQRSFTAPNLGTCNLAEEEQSLVCPHLVDSFHNQMSAVVSAAFYTTEHIQPHACPGDVASVAPNTLAPSLAESWSAIDKEVGTSNNRSDTSVQPRQAAILSALTVELVRALDKTEIRPLNVCMDGFGGGHAAALFLDASPTLRLHLFDEMEDPYQQPILQSLERHYGEDRLALHQGEPSEEFRKVLSPLIDSEDNTSNGVHCDVLFGSNHTLDLVRNAPCGILVASSARTSLQDRKLYFGTPTAQWSRLRQDGCVKDITCFTEDPSPLTLKNRVLTVSYTFCVGVTTGKCQTAFQSATSSHVGNKKLQQAQCDSKMAHITRRIALAHVCPFHKASLPSPKPALPLVQKKKNLGTAKSFGVWLAKNKWGAHKQQ